MTAEVASCKNSCAECPTALLLGEMITQEVTATASRQAMLAVAEKLVAANAELINFRDGIVLDEGFESEALARVDKVIAPAHAAASYDDAQGQQSELLGEVAELEKHTETLRALRDTVSCDEGALRLGISGIAVFRMCRGVANDDGKPLEKWTLRRY